MADLTASDAPGVDSVHTGYMALVRRHRMYSGITIAVFIVMMVSGFWVADARNAGGFWDGWHNMLDFPADVVSEAWDKRVDLPGLLLRYLPALVETVNIAAVATLLGFIMGLVLSLLSTRGLALWPRAIPLFRRLMDILRAIPEIVVALVLIFILSVGPVPAMIAIALHTAGALGKLFSEALENVDGKQIEGVASTGAKPLQKYRFGVIPQVMPVLLSQVLYFLESNTRSATVIGAITGGGIGLLITQAIITQKDWEEVTYYIVLIVILVMLMDWFSGWLRGKLIGRPG